MFDFAKEIFAHHFKGEERMYTIFDHAFEMYNYSIDDYRRMMKDVKLRGVQDFKKGGRDCQPLDYFAVHYKAWMGKKLVQDSHRQYHGKPHTFQQGHYTVVQCWDFSVFLLKAGQQIKMDCPAYEANGGAEVYGDFDSFRIPKNTPLTYELDVLECDSNLEEFNKKMKKYHTKPLVQVHIPEDEKIIGSGEPIPTD